MPSFQGVLIARIELAQKYSENKHPRTQEEKKTELGNCLNYRHWIPLSRLKRGALLLPKELPI